MKESGSLNQLGIFKKDGQVHEVFAVDRRVVVHTADINDFIKTIPDSSIRLIITSLPYNIGKEYETQVALTEYVKTQERLIG